MRRGFSPTSAFGALLVAAGAVLLCTRLAQAQSPHMPISSFLALALELGIYAALLALFDVPKTVVAYPIGAAVLAAVRWGIVLASAAIITGRSGGDVWQEAASIDRLLIPRIASMVFAVIILFPLRDVLQVQSGITEPAAPAEEKATSGSDAMLLFGAGNSGAGSSGAVGDEESETAEASAMAAEEAAQIEGSIVMPAQAALKNVPQDRVNGQVDPGLEIDVPLSIIVPQLKEARIMMNVDDLSALLPVGTLDAEGPPVELPLDEVVVRLPAEVLERPKATSPAWAHVEAQVEELLFTAV